jgi:hypothetical protein
MIHVPDPDAGRINATRRKLQFRHVEIGRWESELTTELTTDDDRAGEGVGTTEQFGDVPEATLA